MSQPALATFCQDPRWPAPIAELIRAASHPAGTPSQRTRRITDCAESLARFLFAVLDAERRTEGLEAGPERVQLYGRLSSATFGMWWKAAAEAGRQLRAHHSPRRVPVAYEMALTGSPPDRSMQALIHVRNDRAHRNSSLAEDEDRLLVAERDFSALITALRPLREHALAHVLRPRSGGEYKVQEAHVHQNPAVHVVTAEVRGLTVLDDEVVISTKRDELLSLHPWLICRPMTESGQPRIRIFAGLDLDDRARYTLGSELPQLLEWEGSAIRANAHRIQGGPLALRVVPRADAQTRPQVDDLVCGERLHRGPHYELWSAAVIGATEASHLLKLPRPDAPPIATDRLLDDLSVARRIALSTLLMPWSNPISACGRTCLLLPRSPGLPIASLGPLEAQRVAEIGRQLAHLLVRLHREGLTAGRLRPDDLLLTADGSPVLLHLGRPNTPDPEKPDLDDAPELARGGAPTPASDQYHLARLLLALHLPQTPPERRLRQTPPALARVLRRCLHPAPRHRFPHAQVLATALDLSGEALALGPPVGAGHVTSTGFHLIDEGEPVAAGLFCFAARDPKGEGASVLVLAPEVQDAWQGSITAARQQNPRLPELHEETDGLLFLTYPGSPNGKPHQALLDAVAKSGKPAEDNTLRNVGLALGGLALAVGGGLAGISMARHLARTKSGKR
jgi:hypothetical protein